jgi:hypothetical protein
MGSSSALARWRHRRGRVSRPQRRKQPSPLGTQSISSISSRRRQTVAPEYRCPRRCDERVDVVRHRSVAYALEPGLPGASTGRR